MIKIEIHSLDHTIILVCLFGPCTVLLTTLPLCQRDSSATLKHARFYEILSNHHGKIVSIWTHSACTRLNQNAITSPARTYSCCSPLLNVIPGVGRSGAFDNCSHEASRKCQGICSHAPHGWKFSANAPTHRLYRRVMPKAAQADTV